MKSRQSSISYCYIVHSLYEECIKVYDVRSLSKWMKRFYVRDVTYVFDVSNNT